MNKKVKTGFKIFGISLGIFVGVMAVVIFIMFLAGAFSPRHTELDNMYFTVNDEYNENNTYFIDGDSFVKVVPEPYDATEIEMTLKILNTDGSDLIKLPESYKIGRPIIISVEKQELSYVDDEGKETKYSVNKGGVVELFARSISQPLECTCTIFIDTLVEQYSIGVTNANGEQLIMNDDNSAFIKYVEDEKGTYYFNANNNKYEVIADGQVVDKKYKLEVSPIYPGNEFYIEISDVFPIYSLDKFTGRDETNVYKAFNVESSDNSIAEITMENYNGKLRGKVKVKRSQEFSISSTLINSYHNMIKKALLDNKEYVNDEDYLMNYVNVVKKFTLISNTLDFKVNNIEVTDLTLNKSNVGTDENFVVGGTYKFNSSNVDRDNSLGLGLVLHAPEGSIYKDEELNSRLSEVEVKAGYYKDGEFVETEEFIGVTTNLSNDLLYITINCYKKNVMYDSYVQFSIDDFTTALRVDYNEDTISSLKFDTNNNLQLSLMMGLDNEIYDLSQYSLISDEGSLNSDYTIRYLIYSNNKVDTENKVLENINGILGYNEYVESLDGKYGYDEESKQYKLLSELQNYQGKYYNLVFRNGYVKLKDDATIDDLTSSSTIFEIYACILKTDFNGNIITYHIDNEKGTYGYYKGEILLISDIEKDGVEYLGHKYSEGLYDYVQSSNCVYVEIGQNFEIADITVIDNETENEVDLKNNFEFDKDNKTVKLAVNEGLNYRLKIKHNKGTNYGGLNVSESASSNFYLRETASDSDEFIYISFSAIKSNSDYEKVSITFYSNTDENDIIEVIDVMVKVNSILPSSLELKANSNDSVNIAGFISGDELVWGLEGSSSTRAQFTLSAKMDSNDEVEIDLRYLSFKYTVSTTDESGASVEIEDDSIINITAVQNNETIELSYVIYKAGVVTVTAEYINFVDGEETILKSNPINVTITVPQVQFNNYTQGATNGEIIVVDTVLVNKEFELGNYVVISLKNDGNNAQNVSNKLLTFEIVNNSYIDKDIFVIANGKLILTKQIGESCNVVVKVGTSFGAEVKDLSGNDVYLNITIKPDVLVVVDSAIQQDANTKIYTYTTNDGNFNFKFENNVLTVIKGTSVAIDSILQLVNSNNKEYTVAKCAKNSSNNNLSITGKKVTFKEVSSDNELYISYLINELIDESTGETISSEIINTKILVNVVDSL